MMASRKFLLATLILSLSGGSFVFAQRLVLKEFESPAKKTQERDQVVQQEQDSELQTEEKREWLRKNMTSHIKNKARLQELNEKFDNLTADEVDRLDVLYQQQLVQAQHEYQQALLLRQQLQQGAQNQQRNVGFAPQITWLPEGASLGVGGVASPDGRSVRISANPFFSSIPFYDTFNFATGQTRHYQLQPNGLNQAPFQSSGFGNFGGATGASNGFGAAHQIPPSSLRLRSAFPRR